MRIFKAEYIGGISHLIGETALCRLVEGELLVQFDNRELTLNGKPIKWTEVENDHSRFDSRVEFTQDVSSCLGFGWHKFDKEDFVRIW